MPDAPADPARNLTQAYQDLLMACRSGDTDKVDSLTLTEHLDVNQVDSWDYSPLILALLCGHIEIVKMLLARGAVCDRDTHQGARCIYGALNEEIRKTLLSYDITKGVDVDQPFLSHLSRLIASNFEVLSGRDLAVWFPNEGIAFAVNRFLLAARSPYFAEQLEVGGAWHQRSVVELDVDPNDFRAVMLHMYLRTDSLPWDTELAALQKFAQKVQLPELAEAMVVGQARKKQQAALRFVDTARGDMRTFLKLKILAEAHEVLLEEEVDFEEIDAAALLTTQAHEQLLRSSAHADIVLSCVDVDAGSVLFYPVHRSILSRAEYYATMLRSEVFLAAHEEVPVARIGGTSAVDRPLLEISHIPVLQPPLSFIRRQVAETVLLHLYHDDAVHVAPGIAVQVLFAADELLMDRLKTLAALSITAVAEGYDLASLEALPETIGYTACELVRIAWQTHCDRVEQRITKLIAHNLKAIFGNLRQELLELIAESATRIRERQDTDTIEFVDDLRFYLAKKYAVYDEFAGWDGVARSLNPLIAELEDTRAYLEAVAQYEQDVAIVDELLEELALKA